MNPLSMLYNKVKYKPDQKNDFLDKIGCLQNNSNIDRYFVTAITRKYYFLFHNKRQNLIPFNYNRPWC